MQVPCLLVDSRFIIIIEGIACPNCSNSTQHAPLSPHRQAWSRCMQRKSAHTCIYRHVPFSVILVVALCSNRQSYKQPANYSNLFSAPSIKSVTQFCCVLPFLCAYCSRKHRISTFSGCLCVSTGLQSVRCEVLSMQTYQGLIESRMSSPSVKGEGAEQANNPI